MDEQKKIKIADLLESGDLDEMLENAETNEDIQKAFAGKGVDLSLDEVAEFCEICVQAGKEGEELSPEQLEEISGGQAAMTAIRGPNLPIPSRLPPRTPLPPNWQTAKWLAQRILKR